MARLVTHTETGPLELKKDDIDGDAAWICQCGLSGDWPLCDGSHAHTRNEEEGTIHTYHREEPNGPLAANEGLPGSLEDADPRPDGST